MATKAKAVRSNRRTVVRTCQEKTGLMRETEIVHNNPNTGPIPPADQACRFPETRAPTVAKRYVLEEGMLPKDKQGNTNALEVVTWFLRHALGTHQKTFEACRNPHKSVSDMAVCLLGVHCSPLMKGPPKGNHNFWEPPFDMFRLLARLWRSRRV